MQAGCARTWQIDAIRDGRLGLQDAESFERHRRVCASCTARLAAHDRLGELARALACKDPTELELRRVRARVMRDTAEDGTHRQKRAGALTRSLAAVLAMFLAAVMLIALSVGTRATRPRARAPLVASAAPPATVALSGAPTPSAASAPVSAAERAYAGSVVPSSDASWSQTRDGRLERLRLDVGTLIVHVRPQEPDERFLVDLPDGELEVRGTTFAVTVRHGSTTHVRVDEGKVELRIFGQHARALIANEVWPAPAPARAHRAAALPTRVVASSPHLPPGASVDTEAPLRLTEDDTARYADAVRLLGAGKYDEAANAFHVFGAGRLPATQAEDASYLEAVALARAGRLDAAALVAERYLDSFPESFHRKEAAILVARAARMRGDCVKARAVLAPWRDGMPDAEAQNVLRTCF